MNKEYMCYCGLYCENCSVKARVEPAAKVLYEEMKRAGFEGIIRFMPNGEGFWSFLKDAAENDICVSCKSGKGGNPACPIRICAKEKGVEMCALCGEYPCGKFGDASAMHTKWHQDNILLRGQGMEAWSKLQDERKARGFTYAMDGTVSEPGVEDRV